MLNQVGLHWFDHLPVIHFNLPRELRDGLQTTVYTHRLNVSYAPHNYVSDLGQINVPLLLLAGSDDEAFYSDKFAHEIEKYTKGKSILVDGVDHLGIVRNDIVIEETIQWLKNI